MFNRYGPWLDVDIVKPIDATTSVVHKAWFPESDFIVSYPTTTSREDFIAESLQSSEKVHDEGVFLCENAQRGWYIPSKQIGAYHFHQRLVQDLRRAASI
jgi:hypothetical protein